MKPVRARFLIVLCLILGSFAVFIAFQPRKAPTPVASIPSLAAPTQTEPDPTITPASTATASPTVAPLPSPTAARRSVFLICWDGGRADLVYDLMDSGQMPNFASIAKQGLRAEYAQSVDPPLSASAQNSISTGAYPARTGIVSNAYHIPSDSFYWYRQGFDELVDQAEPVWVTAAHAGLKTATLFYAGSSPVHPSQAADYTIGYGIQDTYSRQETVPLTPLAGAWQGQAPVSYSPPYEGSFTISRVARVYLYVVDSSDDGQANYDTVLLNTSQSMDLKTPRLHLGEWSPLVLLPANAAGADFKLQDIQPGASPRSVTIYYTGVNHNTASPRELLEALNQKFGFFPAGPDEYAIEHHWITPQDNLYMLERYAAWMAEVTAWVNTTYHPDLLLAWQDGFDSAGHASFPEAAVQAHQLAQDPGPEAQYYRRAASIADQALGTMLKSIDLRQTTLLMVADHGMAPVHTTVYLNTLLEKAGLLKLDSRDYVVVNKTKAFAVASGGAANIYINLKDHEQYGIVTAEEYPQVQAQIIALLNSTTDENGQKVFQRVLPQAELAELHLDHPNSGDVFVQASPGFELDGWRGNAAVFKPSLNLGLHGYDSQLPEMRALFIAAGPGILEGGQVIPPVRIVDYAPSIAALLGFSPAPSVDGLPIPALLQK